MATPTKEEPTQDGIDDVVIDADAADAYVESLRAGKDGDAAADANAGADPDSDAADADETDDGEDAGDTEVDDEVADDAAGDEDEADVEGEGDTQTDASTETDTPKKVSRRQARADMQARLDQQTAEVAKVRREGQEEAARITRENEALKQQLAVATRPKPKTVDELRTEANDPEPLETAIGSENGPKNYEDFNKSHNRWSAREALREERATAAQREHEAAATKPAATDTTTRRDPTPAEIARQADDKLVMDSIAAVRAHASDKGEFDQLMAANGKTATVTDVMGAAIAKVKTTDPLMRGNILKALLKNPAESQRIAGLDPIEQVLEINSLASSLAPTAKSGSSASGNGDNRRVPVLRPSARRSSAPNVPLGQIQDPDRYVEQSRARRAKQRTAVRGAR